MRIRRVNFAVPSVIRAAAGRNVFIAAEFSATRNRLKMEGIDSRSSR